MTYYPILLSKKGELDALARLTPEQKQRTIPILTLVPGGVDRTISQLTKIWVGEDLAVIIDGGLFFNYEGDIAAVQEAIRHLRDAGVNAYPCLSLTDTTGVYNREMAQLARSLECDIAIRISVRGITGRNFQRVLGDLLRKSRQDVSSITLIYDLELLNAANHGALTVAAAGNLQSLPSLSHWKAIVVAGGSFPQDLTAYPDLGYNESARIEWNVWQSLLGTQELGDYISYGDYSTQHPIPRFDAAFAGTISLRYTTADRFVVIKGRKTKEHPRGHMQYVDGAADLVARPVYDGSGFSWADNEIDDYSRRTGNPGNASTWVCISHARHFAKMLALL